MIKPGKTQEFKVKSNRDGKVLLEREGQTLPLHEGEGKNLKAGMTVEAFVYDIEDKKRIATLEKPYIEVGQIRPLKVVTKTKYGAFVDIGLDKDVLFPFGEQKVRVQEGETYLFYMYVDRSDRLAVTGQVKEHLRTDSPYKRGDMVKGRIYHHKRGLGYFVAVDDLYDGLVPEKEIVGIHRVLDYIEGRVVNVLEDGKLTISMKDRAKARQHKDADHLIFLLERGRGKIPVGDKSHPEEIKQVTGLTKKAFKRAVGTLYKDRIAIPFEDKVVAVNKEKFEKKSGDRKPGRGKAPKGKGKNLRRPKGERKG